MGHTAARELPRRSGAAWRFFLREGDRRGRDEGPMGNDVGLVLDDPLDDLAFLKLQGLGHGGGEVDVILVGSLLAGDELNFGGISHDGFGYCGLRLTSSAYTRH